MELLLPQQMYGRIIGTKSVTRRNFKNAQILHESDQ
nr:MAG TPA: hypothetical protein [Bacteriophage sp.]